MTPRRSATAESRALRSATRRRAIRRSDSSCVSPGPRVPTPPPRRSRCCHIPRIRWSEYSSWASSTWSLPSAVWACWAKMSRITVVRSTTRIWSASSSARCWRGASSSSHTTTSASDSRTSSRSSSTLPGPRYVRGSGRRRCWVRVATGSTVAVRRSSCISASPSPSSDPGGREAMMTPRSGVGSRGALRAVDTQWSIRTAGSASSDLQAGTRRCCSIRATASRSRSSATVSDEARTYPSPFGP